MNPTPEDFERAFERAQRSGDGLKLSEEVSSLYSLPLK
jgi:hypothetical protein